MTLELWRSKVVLVLLDKIIRVYVRFTLINVWGPRLESSFQRFVGVFQVIGSLTSKIILKICYRLLSIYLGTYKVVKLDSRLERFVIDLVKRFGKIEVRAEMKAKRSRFLSLIEI